MSRPYIITIASEKGGVGKTTVAINLAIYLKGLAEELPVTLFSFDNHFTVDQMFFLHKTDSNCQVGQLFSESDPDKLVSVGQYGVNYIPSSRDLYNSQNQIQSVEELARNISRSQLQGLIIIDTSPTLDIYTRNALYAADRVIVPIKDAPSLKNCHNLESFLVRHNRSKKVLKILPCLLDTRIHFDGPFHNSYQLLKAYAINRGYRCYEGFIAKSPKVESLFTNPTGKIYPVITHGRNTGVHLQFTHLARQIYLDYLEKGPTRLKEVADTLFDQNEKFIREYRARVSKIRPTCLCCNTPVPEDKIWPNAYYAANESGSFSGFIEEKCFQELLLHDCYPELRGKGEQKLLQELLIETVEKSYLLLQKNGSNCDKPQIDLFRLDREGEKISGRSFLLKKKGLLQRRGKISILDLFTQAENSSSTGSQQLLIRPSGKEPLDILKHHSYVEWQTVFNRILVDQRLEDEAES